MVAKETVTINVPVGMSKYLTSVNAETDEILQRTGRHISQKYYRMLLDMISK